MAGYVARRVLSAIPVLFLVTLIAFGIMQIVPGDPAMIIAGLGATPQEVARVRAQLGLDQPWHIQLARWYQGLARGDLGDSLLLGRSVSRALVERLPVTLSLTGYALVLTLVVGILSGVAASLRPNTWLDQALMTIALLGVSFPSFWLGLMLIVVFAVQLDWLPSGGYVPLTESVVGWLRSTTLPAISLALLQIGLLARIVRATMLEVLGQDYIRTARTKGLPAGTVVWKHAFRNVMIPVVTIVGIIIEPAAERVGGDRDRLLAPGDRAPARLRGPPPRLPGDPGWAPGDRGRLRPPQPAGGRALRVPRPPRPVWARSLGSRGRGPCGACAGTARSSPA